MHYRKLLTALPAILVPLVSSAEPLPSCHEIADDSLRLACYDQWFAGISSEHDREALAASPGADPEPQKVDRFGAERLPPNDLDRVEARLVGDFTGWNGTTVFRLDNGQVWQQTRNYIPNYSPREPVPGPAVTIERGMMGTYNLKIDGVKRIVQVKRIQ